MTWQFGAFAILAASLIGGFAWYERTKPDARLVALVGTLAAFGALGRIAFAAVPNVKPTTDIVLISGYALGGAPGFVVGAISALTSNLFFGQGPWTPWQMAAWGVTGLIGAGLAIGTRGRISRWPLAIVCFVAGFAFTAFQDFGDWVTYSDHSLGALRLYVGKGLGFDLIHATGCLLFALAFGPALNRALRRFKQRLNVQWLDSPSLISSSGSGAGPARGGRRLPGVRILTIGLAAVMLGGVLVGNRAQPARAAGHSVRAANVQSHSPVSYLEAAENGDGGAGMAPGQRSNVLASGWSALALATVSGRQDYASSASGAQSPVQYLVSTVKQERGPGSIERTVLALRAAGVDISDVDGVDFKQKLGGLIGPNGSVQGQTNLTAFAVLALRSAALAVPAKTIRWLARQQDGDGGFNFELGAKRTPSDPDDTGAALEALAHTGNAQTVSRAIAYLHKQQNADGGFPDENGAASNAQSTAFAVQGLVADGVALSGFHRPRGKTPLQYLRSLVRPDGAINYARGNAQTPVWVTAQVQLALARKALPLTSENRHTTASPIDMHLARAIVSSLHRNPAAEIGVFAFAAGKLEQMLLSPIGI